MEAQGKQASCLQPFSQQVAEPGFKPTDDFLSLHSRPPQCRQEHDADHRQAEEARRSQEAKTPEQTGRMN